MTKNNPIMQPAQLDVVRLRQELSPMYITDPICINAVPSVDSTNEALLQKAKQGEQQALLLAEMQTHGRGQHGRSWLSEPGQLIMLSLLHRFNKTGASLKGLSLVVGLAVAEALADMGWSYIQLKWPNDIWLQQKKVGGILIETILQPQAIAAVIGIGINVYSAPAEAKAQQAVTALAEHLPAHIPLANLDRTQITIAIIKKLYQFLETFTHQQLPAFIDKWQRYDGLRDKVIQLVSNEQTITCTVLGIDIHGALLVEVNGEIQRFIAGDVKIKW